MSTTAAKIDSELSGKPSDDIDKQKGPSIGSNAESPGGTLGTATKAASSDKSGSNSAGQSGSSGTGASDQAKQQSSGGATH